METGNSLKSLRAFCLRSRLRVSSPSLPLAMMGRKERMEKEVIRRCDHGTWMDEGRVGKWQEREGWGERKTDDHGRGD